jgi:hypothetical protein
MATLESMGLLLQQPCRGTVRQDDGTFQKVIKVKLIMFNLIEKISFFQDPPFPWVKSLYVIGHKPQVVVVEEVRASNHISEQTQHEEIIQATFSLMDVLHCAVKEKACQVVLYVFSDPHEFYFTRKTGDIQWEFDQYLFARVYPPLCVPAREPQAAAFSASAGTAASPLRYLLKAFHPS